MTLSDLEQRVEELEAQVRVLFQRTVGLVKLGPSPYEPIDSYGRITKKWEVNDRCKPKKELRGARSKQGLDSTGSYRAAICPCGRTYCEGY